MTRHEQTERGRIDRTRMKRFFEAIHLTWPIVDDILPHILGNERAEEEPLKTAASAAYEKACGIVTEVGLEIRHRALSYTVTNVPGRGAGLRIDVEFALAAPLDGPDAPLEWERRSYIGCDAEASEQVLRDCARRYWLCDTLMLPTEADAYPPDRDGDAPPPRTQR